MDSKKPTQRMIDAYKDGQRCREKYKSENEAAYAEVWGGGILAEIAPMPIASAFWRAGFYGHEMPRWASGWRYGRVPECGFSRNYRDDHAEQGVSMMHIEGEPERRSTMYEVFNCQQPRVAVAGWLIGFYGSDGEYLLVGVEEEEKKDDKVF